MVHLLRTAAQVRDLQHLRHIQSHFKTRTEKSLGPVVVLTTRNTPKRAAELLDGGSIYWIVKNIIQARQKILDVETVKDADGATCCQILLDPEIIRVMPVAQRAVQGWRYLDAAKAPKDIGAFKDNGGDSDAPPEMLAELRALGLA